MEKLAVGSAEPDAFGEGSDRRGLSEPLDATDVAINHYRIAPGDGLPDGLHAHVDREEVFVVVGGEATFETMDGEVVVAEREAVRFAPGEFQSGENDSAVELAILAVGAPRDTEDVRIPVDCPECDREDVRLDVVGGGDPRFVCPECGAERTPRGCPE